MFPHYRQAFFRALSENTQIQFDFAFGSPANHSALRVVDSDSHLRIIRLRNVAVRREALVFQFGLLRAMARGEYDAIVAEFNPRILSNLFALVVARLLGIRFIWWGQGFGHRTGALGTTLRRHLASRADGLIVYSKEQADRFVRRGVPAGRVFVATNTIDVAAISALRSESGLDKRFTVLFIGRLIPAKRVDELVRAFAAAQTLPASSRLTIVGDGPVEPALHNLASELGIAHRVDLVGAVYEESELAKYFNAAWCTASVGPIGLAAVHSLAYGVPVIIADGEAHGPEASLLVDGGNACRVRRADPDSFTVAMASLRSDTRQWTRMRDHAVSTVQRELGMARMVEAFCDAVRTAVAHTTMRSPDR